MKEETIQFADEVSFTVSFYHLSSKETSSDESKEKAKNQLTESKSGWDFDSVTSEDKSKSNQEEEDFESVYLQNKPAVNDVEDSLEDMSSQQRQVVQLPPKSMADLLNKTNDFQAVSSNQAQTPSIAYWFGLCKFVVLTPTRSNCFVDSESRAKVILSSISVAINNTGRLIKTVYNIFGLFVILKNFRLFIVALFRCSFK